MLSKSSTDNTVNAWRQQIDARHKELDHARTRVAEEEAAVATAEQGIRDALTAQEFLQTLAQNIQQQVHLRIAQVVSKCLSAVFGERYELVIDFVKVRGRTEAKLAYRKNGQLIAPDVDSGGVRELAALALRLASLVLSLPPLQRVLDLDEPFGGMSATNMPKVAALLKTLSDELQVQFILRTHSEHLLIGKVVRLK